MRAVWTVAIAALVLVAAISELRRKPNPKASDLVTVKADSVTVDAFLVKVADSAGRQITILGTGERLISVDIKDGRLGAVLEQTCHDYGCTWKITPEGRLVVAWQYRTEDVAP